jgi:hypothetical protein
MVARNPLVLIDGQLGELPAGDTVNGAVGGSGAPAGNTKEVQFNNAGTTAGAANVEIDNGDLCLGLNGSPVTPPADSIKLIASRIGQQGSRLMPAAVDPQGKNYVLQPSLWRRKIGRWNATSGTTGVPAIDGMIVPTTAGATSRTVSATNTLTRARRLGHVSSTTPGATCGHYSAATHFLLGNGEGLGGFFYSCRFGISDSSLQAVGRTFVGLSTATGAMTNVEPSTLTNVIGIGNIASNANLSLFYGGSASQAAIDLGSDFPVTTSDLYDVSFWAPSDEDGVVYYCVERIGTSFVATGVLGPGTPGVTLPANTTALGHRAWRTNNTAAAAVGLDISSIYTETDW